MAKWRFAINNTMYNLVAKNPANLQAKNPAFSLMSEARKKHCVMMSISNDQSKSYRHKLLHSVSHEPSILPQWFDDLFSKKR